MSQKDIVEIINYAGSCKFLISVQTVILVLTSWQYEKLNIDFSKYVEG